MRELELMRLARQATTREQAKAILAQWSRLKRVHTF